MRDERVARQVFAELRNLVSADIYALESARPNEIGEGARELIVGGGQHAQVRERGERFERAQRVAIEVGLLHVCTRLDGGNVGQVLVLRVARGSERLQRDQVSDLENLKQTFAEQCSAPPNSAEHSCGGASRANA